MAPLFPTTAPRAELDWQTGHGDGSQCEASGQHIASSFHYHTRMYSPVTQALAHTLTHKQTINEQIACHMQLEASQGTRAQPRVVSLHSSPLITPQFSRLQPALPAFTSMTRVYSRPSHCGARAVWPCMQSTRIATRGSWTWSWSIPRPANTRIVVVCHHRHTPRLGRLHITSHCKKARIPIAKASRWLWIKACWSRSDLCSKSWAPVSLARHSAPRVACTTVRGALGAAAHGSFLKLRETS